MADPYYFKSNFSKTVLREIQEEVASGSHQKKDKFSIGGRWQSKIMCLSAWHFRLYENCEENVKIIVFIDKRVGGGVESKQQ